MAVAVLGALAPHAAAACGYCIEDRIAAVYDHAVVAGSFDGQHDVGFFAITGISEPKKSVRQSILKASESVAGVRRGTCRVSLEAAALSVAFDSGQASVSDVERGLNHHLAPLGLGVERLRILAGGTPRADQN